ncbi:MAG: M23 family metallopeptidase [Lachnospiraceae bacterium]|nr:M23 family metallopeptidase [Butyrivibrio sp.]MCM1342247.1 M23 family metallopeptidase [Muribaculaceae bacterium]MCM1409178.1 M23 family metallopeptidase [Lachnospiraceae bacterium]
MDRRKQEAYLYYIKKGIFMECLLAMVLATLLTVRRGVLDRESASDAVLTIEDDYIKWVDFTVSYEALCKAYQWDVDTHGTEHEICWVELLAYTASRTGGSFGKDALKIMDKAAKALSEGEETMESLAGELKYYTYYREAYDAVLGGLVGEYREEVTDEAGNVGYEERYGLKGYFPLARGFDYTHYDDFGAGRSYGYQRKHLGHDMMGLVGTPIMAVESGVVTALGWNQYGGWRIGISSFDGKRYYYYAHLRQNYPYAEGLEMGSVVTAGDVIGYMGHTGYSAKENVNNIDIVHLHWGLQLIFDESQKEGNNEIWIDLYALTRFLAKHTQTAVKVEGTKEWVRANGIVDPAVEEYEAQALGEVRTSTKEDSLENNQLEGQEVE